MQLTSGYHEVPPGHVAAVVTYLQMLAPAQWSAPEVAPSISLRRVEGIGLDEYRRHFRAVGEPWLWFSRLRMDDATLRATLDAATTRLYFLYEGPSPIGILELDLAVAGEVEIRFFGILVAYTGRGLGRWMMRQALDLAWAEGPKRVWLHTCTNDDPKALAFYRKCGFVPYQLGVEVAPDPRLPG